MKSRELRIPRFLVALVGERKWSGNYFAVVPAEGLYRQFISKVSHHKPVM